MASQNFDNTFIVSSRSSCFKDAERDCERSKQQFRSTSVSCRFGGKGVRCCREMTFGAVLCSSDSERGVGENRVKGFRHTFKKAEIEKGGKRKTK